MGKLKLKILIITAFSSKDCEGVVGEDEYFIECEKLDHQLLIIGLNTPLYYNKDNIGLISTGIGIANAASSVMAVGLSQHLDLTDTHIIVAAIGGLMPSAGLLGTVVCVQNVIGSLCFEIDPREVENKYYKEKLPWLTGSEFFTLNKQLVNKNFELIKNNTNINVIKGNNVTSDSIWHGERLADWANDWVKIWIDSEEKFCISDMEDAGILTSLTRLSNSKICLFNRVSIIRTASNYVFEPNTDPAISIKKHVFFTLAAENTYKAVKILIDDILHN